MLGNVGLHAPSLEELEDTETYIARYARQSIAWIESLAVDEVYRRARSVNRMVALENGKREPLDVGSSGEEQR